MPKRYWCMVCGHGIAGQEGGECPECVRIGRGNPGTLMTSANVEKFVKARAEARKLARRSTVLRGPKTLEDSVKEIEDRVMERITEKYDLVPKGKKFAKPATKTSTSSGPSVKNPVGSGSPNPERSK